MPHNYNDIIHMHTYTHFLFNHHFSEVSTIMTFGAPCNFLVWVPIPAFKVYSLLFIHSYMLL